MYMDHDVHHIDRRSCAYSTSEGTAAALSSYIDLDCGSAVRDDVARALDRSSLR